MDIWYSYDDGIGRRVYWRDRDDGTAGFVILILLVLPFFLMGLFLHRYAGVVTAHPVVSLVLYLLLSLGLGLFFYWGKKRRYRVAGVAAVVITMLPCAWVQAVYAVPYILITEGIFSVVVEWVITTALCVGITWFVLVMAGLFRNGWIQLAAAIVYAGLVFLLTKPPEGLTVSDVAQMYGFS